MKNMDDLQKIIGFLRITLRMKETYRFTPKSTGYENDAEHSWAVAFICMIVSSRIQDELGYRINTERMLKMSLVHDLAEIITGDTKTWDKKSRIGKDERELAAMREITSDLPKDLQIEILDLWEESEAQQTVEAKIVKSVDRMEPVLHRALLGYGWENLSGEGDNATVEALDERQLPRHAFSKVLTELYEAVREEAVDNNMFPSNK